MKRAACILATVVSALVVGYQNAPAVPTGSSATFVNGLAKVSPQMVGVPLNGTPKGLYPNCILRPWQPSRPATTIIS